MPCRGASCLKSLDLVSALLRSGPLAFSADMDMDMDVACLRSELLVLETMVSLVVTLCLSVRRSRSSVDLKLFVRGLPDSVLLCASRSWANLGDAIPPFSGLESKGLRVVLSVLMRGVRDDVFSPAAAPLDAPLPAPWVGFLVDADMFSDYIWRRGRIPLSWLHTLRRALQREWGWEWVMNLLAEGTMVR